MTIQYFENSEAMSQTAANFVFDAVRQNPELLLCTATGNSPKGLYNNMATLPELFTEMRIIPLDEWIDLPTPEASCHAFIEKYLLDPLKISEDRYFGFNTDIEDFENECDRIQGLLKREGPIDVCILGLGKNGHLGFNEPAVALGLHCHVATLAPQSQEHDMLGSSTSKPTKGMTLGMQDILAAKRIILLVAGEGKEAATMKLLSRKISNDCPATWLWKHDNVDCLMVRKAALK